MTRGVPHETRIGKTFPSSTFPRCNVLFSTGDYGRGGHEGLSDVLRLRPAGSNGDVGVRQVPQTDPRRLKEVGSLGTSTDFRLEEDRCQCRRTVY